MRVVEFLASVADFKATPDIASAINAIREFEMGAANPQKWYDADIVKLCEQLITQSADKDTAFEKQWFQKKKSYCNITES